MPSAKNKRSARVVDSKVSAVRNLNREVRQAQKKMAKLLALNVAGKTRWKLEKGKKVETNKLQGFCKDSSRHKGMLSHIDKMKARLKELS